MATTTKVLHSNSIHFDHCHTNRCVKFFNGRFLSLSPSQSLSCCCGAQFPFVHCSCPDAAAHNIPGIIKCMHSISFGSKRWLFLLSFLLIFFFFVLHRNFFFAFIMCYALFGVLRCAPKFLFGFSIL